jgi:hypothetical protein
MNASNFLLRLRPCAVATASGLLCLAAQAQTSPYYVGASQRFEHQTNVFQAASNEVSDTISSTSLLAGLDQPIGRQRLQASATVTANRYQNRSELNHNAYSLLAGLDWETVGNLSGNITADASQSLADFNPSGLLGVTSNNTTRTSGLRGVARLGVVTRLTVEAGGATRTTRYSNPLYVLRNLDINEVFGGVRYRPAGSLVLGLALRATRGEYPNFRNPAPGSYTPEGFKRNNVDLTAEWPISGASRVDARMSVGKDTYETLTARDYSGVTGAVTWRWQASGRTSVAVGYTRTSGDEATLNTTPGQIPYATSATRLSDTMFSTVSYDLTGKIKLNAGVTWVDGSTVSLVGGSDTVDRGYNASLGAVWEATRAIRAGCDVTQRSRNATSGSAGYDAASVGCFGQILLR